MLLRTLFLLLFVSFSFAQNNLVIFSSSAQLFKLTSPEIATPDSLVQEIKFSDIQKDTLNIRIQIKDESTSFNTTIYLLQKGKKVKLQEFLYAVEFDAKSKKAELAFITMYPIKALPDPLLPEKPKEDTTYKWRNNVYGDLFELKNGKPTFFMNLPASGNCTVAMPNENVSHALKLIARTQVDSEKYKYAREVAKNNCISSEQLSHLVKALNFEIDKLKYIKEAYNSITDKSNLKTLESSFKFESSKKEFRDMISSPANFNTKNNIVCVKEISDSTVQSLISDLKLFTTDFEKYQYLKEKAAKFCFKTNQFKSVLNAFVHDREKLDITKLFYNNITDKENMSSLKDQFSYNENQAALLDYLKQQN